MIGDKCQELSWQCPEHRCQFILKERPLAGTRPPGGEGSQDARREGKQGSHPEGAEKVSSRPDF